MQHLEGELGLLDRRVRGLQPTAEEVVLLAGLVERPTAGADHLHLGELQEIDVVMITHVGVQLLVPSAVSPSWHPPGQQHDGL